MTKNAYLFTMAAHATFSVLNDKLLCESYRKAYDRRLAAHPKEYITFYRFLFLTFYRKAQTAFHSAALRSTPCK